MDSLEPFDVGCILSIVFSSFVIVTYLSNRERRRHPATLIASRSVCDLFLCIIWLVSSFKKELDCSSADGRASAFVIEFFVIASESLLACVCLDVIVHAGDPFTDYRANLWLYFVSVFAISLTFAFGLIQNADAHVGQSFLPVCWTKYVGGRVISDTNVPMSIFFYIPWGLIFLLSVAALARACVVLGEAGPEGSGGPARASALRDTRRVIFAHAAYWGAILVFFAPMTNAMDTEAEDAIPHGYLSSVVKFLSGARAIENAMVWFPSMSKSKASKLGGDADLSPVLNTEMQRDVLVAAVVGITTLLREEPLADDRNESVSVASEPINVRLGTWRQREQPNNRSILLDEENLGDPLLESEPESVDPVEMKRRKRREIILLAVSVGPILLALMAAGLAAIVDRNEPTYLCIIFFAAFIAIVLVLAISWQLASTQLRKFNRAEFRSLKANEFRELRDLWGVRTDSIAVSLLEAIKMDARFTISAGRSGAFMFFSPDNRFVIKTIKRQEERTLCDVLLPRLIDYCKRNDDKSDFISLARVFASFEMVCFGRRLCLVIMENVTGNLGAGDTKYDLKGSWYARSAERPKQNKLYICEACGRPFVFGTATQRVCLLNRQGHVPKRLLKDNDFRERILGRPELISKLKRQIARDVDFLASCGVMDYSLLLCVRRRVMHLTTSSASGEWFPSHRLILAALVEGPSAFQFGIIDWFTQFDKSKQLEQFIKLNVFCRREVDADGYLGVSAVDPQQYRDRFLHRVVDVALPLLYNVVQLVDSARDEFIENDDGKEEQAGDASTSSLVCTTLDVSGVDSFARLCQLVSQSTGSALNVPRDKLVCLKEGVSESAGGFDPFEVTYETFGNFKEIAARNELCTLLVDRGQSEVRSTRPHHGKTRDDEEDRLTGMRDAMALLL